MFCRVLPRNDVRRGWNEVKRSKGSSQRFLMEEPKMSSDEDEDLHFGELLREENVGLDLMNQRNFH